DLVNAFLSKITPNPLGGTDPVTGNVCQNFSSSLLGDFYAGPKATPGTPDGIKDSITGTAPGALYGFDVVPKANTSIAETASAQVYTVSFNAFGDESGNTYTLGSPVTLTLVVPPSPP
ncbi:MAG TPA: hypothetical protein VMV03_01750, partial [Spirochaetia bacterium]|nr:hypothetical protein [Spirochaetia bacterium]